MRRPTALIPLAVAAATLALFAGCDEEPRLRVSGTVTDASSGKAIAGARVSDGSYGSQPAQDATTDASGQYAYMTWPEEHGIVAQAPGYQTQTKGFKTSLWQTETEATVDFDLTPEQ